MADAFAREARDRGLQLDQPGFEALHKARILVPLLEVRKDTRWIATHAKRNLREAEHYARWHPTTRFDLEEALKHKRLRDAARVRYRAPSTRRHSLADYHYESPVYLYSPHQVIQLVTARDAGNWLRYARDGDHVVASLHIDRAWQDAWRDESARLRAIVIALSVLDPRYYPDVIGRLSLPGERDFDEYFRWRNRERLMGPLRWLGVDAEWILDASKKLLFLADRIDPLRDWVDLVAEVEPEKWSKLRGDARLAVEIRVRAEILLRYYDRLVAGRRARRLPQYPRRMPNPFDQRLKPRRGVDELLTEYGLSPHPQLLLVLEGETEMAVMPRVMQHFRVPLRDDYISLHLSGGVGRDLTPLVSYAVAPRVQVEDGRRYLNLMRPPTRMLVVVDPEGPVATEEARQRRRVGWVDRIMASMPAEVRGDPAVAARVREQVDPLVHVRTWDSRGQSFEFAHFTDRMLARAIDRLDRRPRKPDVVRLAEIIGGLRRSQSGIDNVLHRVSKVALADGLWPSLEQKIIRAEARNTATRIPIVSVIDEAIRLANEFPRRNLVIGLDER